MIDERRQRDDLYLCPSTLLPDTFSLDAAGFEEYVEACVDAGVAGISYWTLHEVLLKAQGWSSERIRSRLSTAGLRVVCVEAIYGWANATSPAATPAPVRRPLVFVMLTPDPFVSVMFILLSPGRRSAPWR